MADRVVFVHGACVRDGGWWWHPTGALLRDRGVASVAAELPSCGEGGASGAGLAEDASALRLLLEEGGPTIVVAHSYGGIVASEAIAGLESVRHLLLISSYLPEVGQTLADFGGDGPAPFLDVVGETFTVRPELLVETFLQDCPPEVQAEASAHLAHQSLQVTAQPVTAAGWKDVPTTYIVCGQDRGTPAERQRDFARKADRVVEVEAGHHPFLSVPDVVAELVLSLDG